MIKFGTDGWRAVIAEDFTFDNLKIVSQAIADYLNKENKTKVVIGYDARFMSDLFAKTTALVFAANNINVVLSRTIIPTPVISLYAFKNKFDLGIMITASHNSAKFNGLKIKTQDGAAADKKLTDRIEKLLYKNKVRIITEEQATKKRLLKIESFENFYINNLKNFINIEKIKKLKLKILIDLMYGAGNSFIEKVLANSGIKIDYLHNQFNPSFGGVSPEPIEDNLKEMASIMRTKKYDLGIVLDGDADRIATFDSRGNYINAQVILPLLAIHMIKNRKEKKGIAKTVVGSNLIDEVALDLGVNCFETPVGFKYISALFKEKLISIGGEEAGGIGFNGYIPERDGSCAGLLILEMMAQENKSFDELIDEIYKKYGRFFYKRCAISVDNVNKNLDDLKLPNSILNKKIERINRLDGIKLITKNNWLMLRKSGTEPIVRVYAEAKSEEEAERLLSVGKKIIYAL